MKEMPADHGRTQIGWGHTLRLHAARIDCRFHTYMDSSARLGKYMLVDQIGRGAMGEVFRAHDPDLDRYVALKVIAASDGETRLRFRREAQSAARLVHPNIV